MGGDPSEIGREADDEINLLRISDSPVVDPKTTSMTQGTRRRPLMDGAFWPTGI
jgi:hypothetical protein